jgi:hypothetical protein
MKKLCCSRDYDKAIRTLQEIHNTIDIDLDTVEDYILELNEEGFNNLDEAI